MIDFTGLVGRVLSMAAATDESNTRDNLLDLMSDLSDASHEIRSLLVRVESAEREKALLQLKLDNSVRTLPVIGSVSCNNNGG